MNKALRLGMLPAMMALIFLGAATESKAQGVLREVLSRMDTYNKSLVSLKANVRMEKFNSQLRETDVTTGTTSYLPKTNKRVRYVRIDWKEPVVENIVIIGDSFKLYRPRLKQVVEGQVSKAQKNKNVPGNALAFMSMSKTELQANYTVNYLGQETAGGSQTWHIELVPKNKTSYKSAELWVTGNGLPIQAKVIEQNDDYTTVLLSGVDPNVTVSADDFKLNLPKDVKVLPA